MLLSTEPHDQAPPPPDERAGTHGLHMCKIFHSIFQAPFPIFWVGPGDKA